MYTNTGYLNPDETELENPDVPLRINSCGVYRLVSRPDMPTLRPQGRPDYQLLYIASGRAWFTIHKKKTEVTAGNFVLYRPHMPQKYIYYLSDTPEVYWIHFTGYDAERLVKEAGFSAPLPDNIILDTGLSSHFQELFLQIIKELQLKRSCFEEMLVPLFHQLLLLIRRQCTEDSGKSHRMQKEMEQAIHYFNENFTQDIEIEEYAKNQHMSTCWFIRSFRRCTGMPPLQYLTSLRISKAKELLESTGYTVSEIGSIVGYDNPLYFSRIFKRQTGLSPARYRKRL